MFTHVFCVCIQLTQRIFLDRMKLAAEIEFLHQEIWNKMRDKLLVDLMTVAVTRTLSFFANVSVHMNVF